MGGQLHDGRRAPSPFLWAGRCSGYERRPMACRTLIKLDDDDLLCRHAQGVAAEVPHADATKLKAFALMAQPGTEYADIREFSLTSGASSGGWRPRTRRGGASSRLRGAPHPPRLGPLACSNAAACWIALRSVWKATPVRLMPPWFPGMRQKSSRRDRPPAHGSCRWSTRSRDKVFRRHECRAR